MTKKHAKFLFILFALVMLISCGSDEAEEVQVTQDSPSGLAELLYGEMSQKSFDCVGDLYFGSEKIVLYYNESSLGSSGTIGVCQKLKEEAKYPEYQNLIGKTALFESFVVDEEGLISSTIVTTQLPYVEGTVKLSDGTFFHINRMVQHENKWYILVLRSYPRIY